MFSVPRPGHYAWAVGMLLFCAGLPAWCQRVDFTYRTYGLELDGDNVVRNAAHLEGFYEKLLQLQQGTNDRVSIVHIGDSHIQADYMTSVVRRNFHRHFGNAGRGLIVPLRVAGTNEPNNFKTQSNVSWQAKRCVFPDRPLPVGIGGVTIESTDPKARLEVFMNDLWLDYSFNTLTLFYQKDERSFDFAVRDSGGALLGMIDAQAGDPIANLSKVHWEKPVNSVVVEADRTGAAQGRATIFGLVLENSQPGVLYHTIGVNGAKFKHYRAASHFAEQTALLEADMFIISLGTNESVDYPYVDKNLPGEVAGLVADLRRRNPEAAFLLVTPQAVYREKSKVNPGIAEVRGTIIRHAVEYGLGFYDLYRAMGGEASTAQWSEEALLSRDGIHLTKDGYEYQGNLFYHALMKGYNQYVLSRRQ